MALVKCRECASDVSDSAATCPRCGVSAPAGMATLTFVRTGLRNGAVPVEVFVDGKPYGTMRMKGSVAVPVPPGNHHVELRTGQGKSTVGDVTVSPGDTVLTVTLSVMGSPRFE